MQDVGFMGSQYFETPHLDALAEESLVFEQAYMYPTCSPSRAAILTGKQSFRTGCYTVPVLERGSRDDNLFSRWTVEAEHPVYAKPLNEAADYAGRFVWSAQRLADGTVAYQQPCYHLHTPPAAVDVRSQADGMAVTEDGWLLVATAMGIQICDQPGRVHLILPMPPGERHPSNVTFGGEDGQTLYATAGGKVFKRKLNLTGALPWKPPIKPEKPRL